MFNPENKTLFGKESWEEKQKKLLEERLQTLIGKEVSGFEVDDLAIVRIKFEDGTELSFNAWNAYDDKAGFEYIEIESSKENHK